MPPVPPDAYDGRKPDDPVPDGVTETTAARRGIDDTPTRIGPYRILEAIGEGGMGIVYLAEQETPVRRKVALKIIKLGMDTREIVARFEAERQALAMMSHPNIAKVFDAGATERGRPYFVMEYVPGEAITTYCDRHRLSTRKRLDLYMTVCHAIQHAHQKSIIHRDIKPSNVLVMLQDGLPVAKVIDFGVAKAIDQRLTEKTLFTAHGRIVGTPAYMSPEQLEMTGLGVDTTTDVYSLGVLLYELLTGALPFDPAELERVGRNEIARHIREEEPPKPSTRISSLGEAATTVASRRATEVRLLTRLIRGDLDWITMRAMEKDRTRRYASASGLAADVERFLGSEPIVARPPGKGYVLKKMIQRHRVAFTVSASLFVLLAVFGMWMSLLYAKATRAEHRARTEALTSTRVSEFMVDLFDRSDPRHVAGEIVTVREILDRGAEKIAGDLEHEPVIRARMLDAIGRAYRNLGMHGQARPLLEEALELRREALGAGHPDVATTLHSLGEVTFWMEGEKHEEAEELLRAALAIRQEAPEADPTDVAETMRSLGKVLSSNRDYAGAESLLQEALDLRRRALGERHPYVAQSLADLGALLRSQRDHDAAEPLLREALAIRRESLGGSHPDVAHSLSQLAGLLWMKGDHESAEPLLGEAVDILRTTHRDGHPDLANAMGNLGDLLLGQGRPDEAEPLLRDSLEMERRFFPHGHLRLDRALVRLANLLEARGQYAESVELNRQLLDSRRIRLGDDHARVADTMNHLGELLRKEGEYAAARDQYERSLAIVEKAAGADGPEVAIRLHNIALCLAGEKRRDEGAGYLQRAHAIWRKQDEPYLVPYSRASFLVAAGEPDAAVELVREALRLGMPRAWLIEDEDLAPLRSHPDLRSISGPPPPGASVPLEPAGPV